MTGPEGDYGGGVDLPPPPPVPEGALPARAPGYSATGGGNSSSSLRAEPVIPLPKKASRPGFGKAGRPVELAVNHFKARLVKWDDVYHYNVSTIPGFG